MSYSKFKNRIERLDEIHKKYEDARSYARDYYNRIYNSDYYNEEFNYYQDQVIWYESWCLWYNIDYTTDKTKPWASFSNDGYLIDMKSFRTKDYLRNSIIDDILGIEPSHTPTFGDIMPENVKKIW